MKKILFITNRNIVTTSGELRLIKNRAEVLYNKYGISSDFVALTRRKVKDNKVAENINAGGLTIVKHLGVIQSLLMALGIGLKKIIHNYVNGDYDAIILSGTCMPLFTKEMKCNYKVPIILDIHGASEDILEIARVSSFPKKILFNIIYRLENRSLALGLKYASAVFAVTKALEDYLRQRYDINDGCQFFLVPCATTEINIVANKHEMRNYYRAKYGINEKDIVFLYSGGVSPWQCVEETINLYKEVARLLPSPSRMVIYSHMIEKLKEMIGDDDRFILDSYKPNELPSAMCLADYAFLLRKDNPTNNVAFPNKFLEYVQCGLYIISTPFVYEIKKQIVDYNIGIIYDFKNLDTLIRQINENKMSIEPDKVINILTYNSFKCRLETFADFIS